MLSLTQYLNYIDKANQLYLRISLCLLKGTCCFDRLLVDLCAHKLAHKCHQLSADRIAPSVSRITARQNSDVTWVCRPFESPTTQPFVRHRVQPDTSRYVKAQNCCFFVRQYTGHRRTTLTKGATVWKMLLWRLSYHGINMAIVASISPKTERSL